MAVADKWPTVAETLQHPSYPDATWNLQPTKNGLQPVALGRGGPIKIGWEVHGEGPIKVVFIAGLGSFKTTWQRQTLYFGHEHYKEYSVLLVDNRGMGDSDKPLMRYSTREMALDVLEVLEHVGFVDSAQPYEDKAEKKTADTKAVSTDAPRQACPISNRTVHVVGISMGGMISQELALLAPDRIASLNLCCTAAIIENTSPTIWENLASRAVLILPKGVEESVRGSANRILNPDWLLLPDDAQVPKKGTHLVGPPERTVPLERAAAAIKSLVSAKKADKTEKEASEEEASSAESPWYRTFDNNGQRFVAQEVHKRLDPRFTTKGFMMQLIACGWHHKTPEQLRTMADLIGRERIMIMHGTVDNMISVPHGRKLIEYIEPGVSHIEEGMSHAPSLDRWAWYNAELERQFTQGEKLAGRVLPARR